MSSSQSAYMMTRLGFEHRPRYATRETRPLKSFAYSPLSHKLLYADELLLILKSNTYSTILSVWLHTEL
jgi:hypothetical protein